MKREPPSDDLLEGQNCGPNNSSAGSGLGPRENLPPVRESASENSNLTTGATTANADTSLSTDNLGDAKSASDEDLTLLGSESMQSSTDHAREPPKSHEEESKQIRKFVLCFLILLGVSTNEIFRHQGRRNTPTRFVEAPRTGLWFFQ